MKYKRSLRGKHSKDISVGPGLTPLVLSWAFRTCSCLLTDNKLSDKEIRKLCFVRIPSPSGLLFGTEGDLYRSLKYQRLSPTVSTSVVLWLYSRIKTLPCNVLDARYQPDSPRCLVLQVLDPTFAYFLTMFASPFVIVIARPSDRLADSPLK